MEDRVTVAIITFVVSLLGAITNIMVLCAARKLVSMNSSFGIITKNQAISNTILCFVFLFCAFPWQLEFAQDFISYSYYVGIIATTMYHASIMFHFFLAFNRLCAVFFPLYYKKLFTNLLTINVNLIIWLFAFIKCLFFYGILGCFFQYYESFWTFSSLVSEKCDAVNWYTDFIPNNTFGALIVTINLVSAYRAGRNTRKLSTPGIQMTKIQRQREIYFIKQTFFQGTSVFAGLVTYYILAPLFTNDVILCVLSTLWAFMQALEGVIIFASNREMRSVYWKKGNLYFLMDYFNNYGEFSIAAGIFIMVFERYGSVFFSSIRSTKKYKLWFSGIIIVYLMGLSLFLYLMRKDQSPAAQLFCYSFISSIYVTSFLVAIHLCFSAKKQYYKTLGQIPLAERYMLSESYELCRKCFVPTFCLLAINISLFISFWLFVSNIIPFYVMYQYFLVYDIVLNISATLFPILFLSGCRIIRKKTNKVGGPEQVIELRQLNGNRMNTSQSQEEYFRQLQSSWA